MGQRIEYELHWLAIHFAEFFFVQNGYEANEVYQKKEFKRKKMKSNIHVNDFSCLCVLPSFSSCYCFSRAEISLITLSIITFYGSTQ